MATHPESMQPAHDKLRDIWHKIAEEEERVQNEIHNTPDPVFHGGEPSKDREEMIRTFEIVRAHRRFTRSCIDYLSWGEPVDKLPHFSDKTKAERATEAAEAFDKAVNAAREDLTSRLYDLAQIDEASAENLKAILRNFTYALDSARADLRKGLR